MKGTTYSFFGFDTTTDFMATVFGYKYLIMNFIFASIALISSFITGYVWESTDAVWTLYGLMFFDWVSGVYSASRNKLFNSKKFGRMIILYFVNTGLLTMAFHLSKASIMFMPLPSLIYGGLVSIYLISLIENLSLSGLLPKQIAEIIKHKFGFSALFSEGESKTKQKKKD